MSISLIVSGAGAVVAAVGVGLLMARSLRAPRGDLIAWAVALLGLLVSLGAQALGHLLGFGQVSFRAMEIGGQLIAPLALVMGLVELAGTSVVPRFCSRLFLPCLGFVALVILGSDPMSGTAFSKAWPAPAIYYQLIPNKLIEYGLAPVSLVLALIVGVVVTVRSARSPQWRAVTVPALAAVLAVVALAIPGLAPELSAHLGLTVPLSTLFAVLCLLAAALTWFAGVRVEHVPLAALRGGGPVAAAGSAARGRRGPDPRSRDARDRAVVPADGDDDQASGWQRDQAGDFEPYDDGGQGVYRDGGLYRDDPGYGRPGAYAAEDHHAAQYQGNGAGAYDSREMDPAYGPAGNDTGSLIPGYAGRGGAAGRGDAGRGDAGRGDAGPGEQEREQLFGQIAIYTLIEDGVEDFDRLTERVVKKVRDQEPDTLVYIVHAVPSAPMQRILYEVYRDRGAFDRHRQQPYVADFEADRRPYVLATNVIELGLQQAKVSPFPSITDLFPEPGYDTSGFERPDYSREYGDSARQGRAPR